MSNIYNFLRSVYYRPDNGVSMGPSKNTGYCNWEWKQRYQDKEPHEKKQKKQD